jgi:hypothetical protein
MKKIVSLGALLALVAAVPATADRGGQRNERAGTKERGQTRSESRRCRAHRVAYVASGRLTAANLTALSLTKADPATPDPNDASEKAGSYDGSVSFTVSKTNKFARAHKGDAKTYELDDDRVTFGIPDRNADGKRDQADLQAGDRAKVTAKVRRINRRCSGATAFNLAALDDVNVRHVIFTAPDEPSS